MLRLLEDSDRFYFIWYLISQDANFAYMCILHTWNLTA